MTSVKPRSKPSHQARPAPPPPLADPETPGSGFQSSEVEARVGRGQQRPALPREPAGGLPRTRGAALSLPIPLLWCCGCRNPRSRPGKPRSSRPAAALGASARVSVGITPSAPQPGSRKIRSLSSRKKQEIFLMTLDLPVRLISQNGLCRRPRAN